MSVALHPSERAALRQTEAAVRQRLWREAARRAAVIVGCIALLIVAALALYDPARPARAAGTASISYTAATPPEPALPVFASPGSGVTGTTELPPEPLDPPLPVPATATGITPAAPFTIAGTAPLARARALECLTAAIYYEAASEPDDGQRAVAQVVLNRVRHRVFPASVCGVVYQGAERSSGCQFSFACDGAMARVPSRSGWARAARTAAAALGGYVYEPVGLATHYHTYAVTPAWNRTLVMTDAVGAHFFHRWKGYWGTAAAFRQRYTGVEPLPGPPPRPEAPAAVIALARHIPVVPPPVTPAADIQPAHRDSGLARDTTTPARDTLPDTQILDRWKDSGKPLR